MKWHSTTLKYLTDHCPRALKWAVDGKPYDRDVSGQGIAAHAVLQAFHDQRPKDDEALRALSLQIAENLIADGYRFRGQQQPPIQPDAAMAGADLASRYIIERDIPTGEAERDFEGDNIGAVIDLVYMDQEGGEDWSIDVVAVRDYKSSWQTGTDDLNTLQRKIQALTVAAAYPDAQALRLEVVNLRNRWTYSKLMVLDEDGQAELRRWSGEVGALCAAADRALEAPAPRPGAGCLDCPFVMSCDACAEAATDPENIAESIATSTAILRAATNMGKKMFTESPEEINGGLVGFFEQKTRTVGPDEIFRLFCQFTEQQPEEVNPAVKSFLFAAGLGVTQAGNVIKVLHPDRQDRLAAEAEVFGERIGSVFKVKRK